MVYRQWRIQGDAGDVAASPFYNVPVTVTRRKSMHLNLIIVKLHFLKMSWGWQQITSLSLQRSGPPKCAYRLISIISCLLNLNCFRLFHCSDSLPSTAIDALNAYSETIFPNIHTLLKIACTLPVITSSAERSLAYRRRRRRRIYS